MTKNKNMPTKEEFLNTLANCEIESMEPIQGSLHYEGEGHGKYENERITLSQAAKEGLEAGKKLAAFPKMPGSDGIMDWHIDGEPSGVVWIVFRPENSKIAKAVKKIFDTEIDASYKGGVMLRIRRFYPSYLRNVAYAVAFAEYLQEEGYDAVAGFLVDGEDQEPELKPIRRQRTEIFHNKIEYRHLNAKQKESYNFQKASGILAEYGYTTIRLSDDWEGADFLAKHVDGETIIKVQLKGRLTILKNYIEKNIYICFPDGKDHFYLFPHDKVKDEILAKTNIGNTRSWNVDGGYSFPGLNNTLLEILEPYLLEN
jgi:hypothetical protein